MISKLLLANYWFVVVLPTWQSTNWWCYEENMFKTSLTVKIIASKSIYKLNYKTYKLFQLFILTDQYPRMIEGLYLSVNKRSSLLFSLPWARWQHTTVAPVPASLHFTINLKIKQRVIKWFNWVMKIFTNRTSVNQFYLPSSSESKPKSAEQVLRAWCFCNSSKLLKDKRHLSQRVLNFCGGASFFICSSFSGAVSFFLLLQ